MRHLIGALVCAFGISLVGGQLAVSWAGKPPAEPDDALPARVIIIRTQTRKAQFFPPLPGSGSPIWIIFGGLHAVPEEYPSRPGPGK
jgi:hypothetical protein